MPNGQSPSISNHSAVSEGWTLENTRAEFYLFSSIQCIFNCNSVFYILGEPLVQVFPSFKVIIFKNVVNYYPGILGKMILCSKVTGCH